MKKIAVVIFAFLLSAVLNAQLNKFGTPIVKSYSTEITTGSDQNWWITKDKFGAVYFANNDHGVIRFDGTEWVSIPVRNNAQVRALDADRNGIIYVGGANEFGFIEPDSIGTRKYVSLSKQYEIKTYLHKNQKDSIDISDQQGKEEIYIGDIVSVAVADSVVYYLSDEALFIYNIKSQDLLNINLRDLGFREFIRIHKIGKRIILSENLKGLFEFKDGRIIELPGGKFFSEKICLSILPVSDSEVLVSTFNSRGLYLLNIETGEIDDNWVDPAVNDRIQKVYCGAKMANGNFVIGTVNGDGIYVLDSAGKWIGLWNPESGVLEDDLIYALYADLETNELWVSVTSSISKIYTDLPYMTFSEDKGIDAVVNGLNELGNIVYATTDKGVYKSAGDKNGYVFFEKMEEIGDQSFPIISAEVDNETFLLAGTILGVYQIKSDGTVLNVEDKISLPYKTFSSTYSSFHIVQSRLDPHIFYLGSGEGVIIIEYRNKKWSAIRKILSIEGTVNHQVEAAGGDLFITSQNPNNIYRLPANDTIEVNYRNNENLSGLTINSVSRIDQDIVISTTSGLFKYIGEQNSWMPCNEITGGFSAGKNVNITYQDEGGDLWLELNEGKSSLMLFMRSDSQIISYSDQFRPLPNVRMTFPNTISGKVWIGKAKNIVVVDKIQLTRAMPKPSVLLSKIIIGGDSVLMDGTFFKTLDNGRRIPQISNQGLPVPGIKYKLNSVSLYWTSPSYIYEEMTQYSYLLEGFASEWSKWDFPHYKDFTNLPFGEYTFRVKARTSTGIESPETSFVFEILKPWYLNTFMIILYVIAVSLIIFGIIAAYTRNLKNENLRLESIIAERTKVVVKQKEELESSIHYASRIQMALLPSEAILSESIKNYFVLFRPRDIVSGDFYWMTKKANRLYIVAADCTGHGVPGAFMSLLGMSFLDEIIDKDITPRADMILNELRQHVTDSLKQSGSDNEAKDGMDMSLLVIDFNVSLIEFSGAYNPCFRVRKLTDEEIKRHNEENVELPDGTMTNGKYLLETIYASKMPIGISSRMDEKFIFHSWKLEKGVSYYLFSDGYIDQFGGPSGRKFMKKNFKRLILDIQDNTMAKQKEIMEKTLQDWMGKTPQIDDILVMGIRTE